MEIEKIDYTLRISWQLPRNPATPNTADNYIQSRDAMTILEGIGRLHLGWDEENNQTRVSSFIDEHGFLKNPEMALFVREDEFSRAILAKHELFKCSGIIIDIWPLESNMYPGVDAKQWLLADPDFKRDRMRSVFAILSLS